MDISKAIEIMGFIKQDLIPINELDQLKALNMGIEALKDKASYRKRYPRSPISRLPSETIPAPPLNSFASPGTTGYKG